jgi:prepilin-type processing-associated H-X9-DG protein
MALLLPAVQYCREASRRISCANNLHNQVLALHEYHASYNCFPIGVTTLYGHETSWYLEVLPHLEQSTITQGYDRTKAWDDPASNLALSSTLLKVLECPTSALQFPGNSDYGGVSGSSLTATNWGNAFDNGVIIKGTGEPQRISFASILDGSSQTICIAESVDRPESDGGQWISALNCFSHDNGTVSSLNAGEIFSLHGSGANVAFTDGSTRFLTTDAAPTVVGALCTRAMGELVDGSTY